MAVTAEQSAPYASSGVMLGLLERNREKGLPNPMTNEQLQRLGVSDSLLPRTMQALRTLDLIGEDGRHTGILENLRRAPEAEYQAQMAAWLMAAYEHALDVVDPATSDEVTIRDAFRHYSPISMQPRMVTLFISLFEAAGVRPLAGLKATPKKASPANATPRLVRAVGRSIAAKSHADRVPPPVAGLHPALAGLLASLPSGAQGWTQADRDRFMTAFGFVLDFAHPPGVVAQSQPDTAEADDADA